MITAKQARELARPKFDKKANENIKSTMTWVTTLIQDYAKKGQYQIGIGVENLNEYEVQQVILRLRKQGFIVQDRSLNHSHLSVSWMKQ